MKFFVAIILLFISLGIPEAKAQENSDSAWLKFQVINNTNNCKLFNIVFHYNKGTDSLWGFSIADRYRDTLYPHTISSLREIHESEININYYTFDYLCNGRLLHKRIEKQIILESSKENIIEINAFDIPPIWWQSNLFILFLGFVISLIVFLTSRLQYKAKLKKQKTAFESERILQKERERIGSEMHDDIGSGLLALRLKSESLYSRIDNEPIKHELESFNKALKEISLSVREIIWSLDSENDSLENLISFIIRQSKRLVENSGIDISIDTSKLPLDKSVSAATGRNIYLIVKESIHNCIKHSCAAKITLAFTYSQSILSLNINDNGKGINNHITSEEGNGLGNIKKRVFDLGGSISLDSSNTGTAIAVLIPI